MQLGDGNQGAFELADVAWLVSFLLLTLLIIYVRAFVCASEPVTGAGLRVQGCLLVAECVGGGLLVMAMSRGADLIPAALTGSGFSLLITGRLVVTWIRALPPRASTSAHGSPHTGAGSGPVCAPPSPTSHKRRGMKTVESPWRNLAKGHDKARVLELALQCVWARQVEEAQRQEYQANLDAWHSRQEQRVNDDQRALSIWMQAISDQRLRLRAATISGIRRARVVVPVSVLFLEAMALSGIVLIGTLPRILLGIGMGFVAAFTPAVFESMRFVELRFRKPSAQIVEDPRPQPDEPIRLALVDRWWQQISDDGTYQSKAKTEHGDEGEEQFYRHLVRSLPDDHVGARGILAKRGLDVDLLVVGPTNVWVFEVKHWTGTIVCRNGSWRRSKPYYALGGVLRYDEREIKPFDHQWIREREEIEETLRRRVRPSHLADQVTGGLVFTHPNVVLGIDQSVKCGFGPSEFWATHLQEVACGNQESIALPSKLAVLDGLLDRAETIDRSYAQRRCSIELAEQLAVDWTDWAKNYVACHSRL